MNPYCFDISRSPTVKSNAECKLTLDADVRVSATGADIATNYDLCIVLERLRTCTLHVSAGGVSVMVKDGAE